MTAPPPAKQQENHREGNDFMKPVWTGNPLSKEGTRGKLGRIEAELMHVDCTMFGVRESTPQLRRTWMLNIFDVDVLRIDRSCLASMVLVNLLAEPAKREAEQIMEWAYEARFHR